VAPGPIRTELGGGIGPEFEAQLAGQTSLGRIGEAEEVGRMIAALASPAMAWVNAQTIEIGGGYCI
jgi:NAD(P)-dependent dehydrogenase (short-subunit alcohol dehydrogenase family)